MEEITLKEISDDNFYNLEAKILEARDKIISQSHCQDSDVLIYIPEYMQRFITNHCPIEINSLDMFFGIKVLIGYENAIIVAHKEAALRGLPSCKITFN